MKVTLLLITCLVITVAQACTKHVPGPAEPPPDSSPAKPAPSPLTGFAKDLQYIKNGNYTYVWVFSRKDGKALDKADGDFLRANARQVVDWVTTDEGRKVIGGTNFNLEEGNLELIKKRFNAEDYTGR